MEAYIDNMVVKRKHEKVHIGHLSRVFRILKKHQLRLKAEKCAFGVGSGKFLGYLVTQRGIKADPKSAHGHPEPQIPNHHQRGATPNRYGHRAQQVQQQIFGCLLTVLLVHQNKYESISME